MKKRLIVLMIFILFASMSATTAINIPITKPLNIEKYNLTKKSVHSIEEFELDLPVDDWDGEFAGAYGNIIITEEGRDFETYGYIGGVYIGDNFDQFYGNIYNIDKEQIGTIGAYSKSIFMVGRIQNIEEKKAPIVGFLLKNETMFFGRMMSLFGPAPYIIGYHWET